MINTKEYQILSMLIQKNMYGLELVDESNGHLKKGTIYTTLKRLEENRVVRSTLIKMSGQSPKRRVYSITNKGIKKQKAIKNYNNSLL